MMAVLEFFSWRCCGSSGCRSSRSGLPASTLCHQKMPKTLRLAERESASVGPAAHNWPGKGTKARLGSTGSLWVQNLSSPPKNSRCSPHARRRSHVSLETWNAPLAPETVVKGPQGDLPQRLGGRSRSSELERYSYSFKRQKNAASLVELACTDWKNSLVYFLAFALHSTESLQPYTFSGCPHLLNRSHTHHCHRTTRITHSYPLSEPKHVCMPAQERLRRTLFCHTLPGSNVPANVRLCCLPACFKSSVCSLSQAPTSRSIPGRA